MVLIIIATCAAWEFCPLFRPKLLPCTHYGRFSRTCYFPSYRGWQLKDAGTDRGNITGATGVGAVAFRRRGEFTLPSI